MINVCKNNSNKNLINFEAINMNDAKQAIPGGQKTPEQSIFQDFALINSYFLFTLLDRVSFSHYNNTKIIKFGWEIFILWVISYGLSFLGFARFPEFRGTSNDSFGRP